MRPKSNMNNHENKKRNSESPLNQTTIVKSFAGNIQDETTDRLNNSFNVPLSNGNFNRQNNNNPSVSNNTNN